MISARSVAGRSGPSTTYENRPRADRSAQSFEIRAQERPAVVAAADGDDDERQIARADVRAHGLRLSAAGGGGARKPQKRVRAAARSDMA